MPPPPARFRIPSKVSVRSILSLVGEGSSTRREWQGATSVLFLDTADWRAHSRGWTLEAQTPLGRPSPARLILRDRATEAPLASSPVVNVPLYAVDLPASGMWSELAAAIEGRRLLVHASGVLRGQRLAVLDSEAKTTARLQIERYELPSPSGRPAAVGVATITPVRGYEPAAARLESLVASLGLVPVEEGILAAALRVAGCPGPEAVTGPGVPLVREMPARTAVALVLGRLREHLTANQEGVAERLDTEFLHEFRVAVRRARSIVRQSLSCLDEAPARHFATELGWLGGVTSPVRDLDVHIEELEAGAGDDLESLRYYLAAQRDHAQRELVEAIRSRRYGQLLDEWGRMADPRRRRARGVVAPPDAPRPIGEVADGYIWRAFRRVVRDGGRIDAASPPERLHDLRKRAKELRYLLECFQALYPDEVLRPSVKELKAFQDNLGEYQDCQVQAAALRNMAEQMIETGAATARTLMAMGRLADAQERREAAARAEFDERFTRFASSANRRRFASLTSRSKGRSEPEEEQT